VLSKVSAPNRQADSTVPKSRKPGGLAGAGTGVERETLPLRQRRGYRPRQLNAGPFTADVASFRLHLAAENKAPGTIRIYTEAPLWFAAAYLLRETEKSRWEQVDAQDVQRWVVWLLGGYSEAYARQQYRALRQFSCGWPPRRRFPTLPPGCARLRCGRSRCRFSPA
jgi:hypothetical protein